MHVYFKLSFILFKGAYSQINVLRIAACSKQQLLWKRDNRKGLGFLPHGYCEDWVSWNAPEDCNKSHGLEQRALNSWFRKEFLCLPVFKQTGFIPCCSLPMKQCGKVVWLTIWIHTKLEKSKNIPFYGLDFHSESNGGHHGRENYLGEKWKAAEKQLLCTLFASGLPNISPDLLALWQLETGILLHIHT